MDLLWSTEDVHFVSHPVDISGAGVVVTYIAEEGELFLVAIEPATGKEVWRLESTASAATPGVTIEVVHSGTGILHLAELPDGSDVVQTVDAATGEPEYTSLASEDGFKEPLGFCDSDHDRACVTAVGNDDGEGAGIWEFDLETGGLSYPTGDPAVDTAPGVITRAVGEELYELYNGDIARIVDRQLVWQRPPSELFGGEAVEADSGWSFEVTDDLFVGWLGAEIYIPEDGSVESPTEFTAGIDRETGDTRWVHEGRFGCLNDLLLRVDEKQPWVQCVRTGRATLEDGEATSLSVETMLEGFDPDSGEVLWTFDLGQWSSIETDRLWARLGETTFATSADDGRIRAVDVRDGTAVEVKPDDVGWCVAYNEYEYGDSDYEYRSGESFHNPCSLDGERRELPADVDEDMGIVVADVFVWMDEAGLHGARILD